MNTDNSPEKKNNDSVLDAFAKTYDSDEEFRERWRSTVEEARKRKEERRLAEEERLRQEADRKLRAEAGPRVSEEKNPTRPLDLNELAIAAKNAAARKAAAQAEKARREREAAEAAQPEEPEPAELKFDPEAAASAQNEVTAKKNTVAVIPTIRDRKFKKNFFQRIGYKCRVGFSKNGIKRFVAGNFPVKGDSGAEIVRKCIRAASFIALACALVFLGNYLADYVKRIKQTDLFQQSMEKYENYTPEQIEDAWAQIKAQYPEIEFPEGMNIKFSELYAMNQHVVGWVSIPNTKINTVLLQADNNTYHLRMNIYDEYSRFGNPYVHYKCSMGRDGLSKNTILYGHNANDGLMFHDLTKYMTVEGYLNSPVITLDTLYEQTKWKVFAVVLTNCHPSEDNGYVWQYLYPEFNSADHFKRVLSEIDERTIIRTGVDVAENDKILTMYTCCTYQLDSGRLAVFARQLREGESEEIDTSRVYYNSNARYPQEWYTRKNKVNPYADPTEAATKEQKTTAADNGQEQTAPSAQTEETSAQSVTSDENVTSQPAENQPPETQTPTEQPPEVQEPTAGENTEQPSET